LLYQLEPVRSHMKHFILISVLCLIGLPVVSQTYSWKGDALYSGETISSRIPVPDGFERVIMQEGSFGQWLRHLPVKSGEPTVYLYNGNKKRNQSAQFAIVDIDTGNRDLQQCADAVMRLRAEYQFSSSQQADIAFNFTSGDRCSYSEWSKGIRPKVAGNNVSWIQSASPDRSYQGFRKYLNRVFSYAGTYSLKKELHQQKPQDLSIGDVFIQGGFPGHAVLIVDMAANPATGQKIFLLVQSYMPAQDIHILKNPGNSKWSPWFSVDFGEELVTPEWTFHKDDMRRFD